ncbi:hypothetical protein [Streptomyces sp. NPDC004296]|uniref:hypothetical protein n=1 Tax=Streptomyces sp. NPDC004296 TaxID=3364697 RepID=UPI0036A22B8D
MSIDAPHPSGRRRPASDPPQTYIPLWRRLREDEWPPLDEVLRGPRGQMRPRVLLMLLLPCLWWLTVPLLVGYCRISQPLPLEAGLVTPGMISDTSPP